jgi:hypothetical protein
MPRPDNYPKKKKKKKANAHPTLWPEISGFQFLPELMLLFTSGF